MNIEFEPGKLSSFTESAEGEMFLFLQNGFWNNVMPETKVLHTGSLI